MVRERYRDVQAFFTKKIGAALYLEHPFSSIHQPVFLECLVMALVVSVLILDR